MIQLLKEQWADLTTPFYYYDLDLLRRTAEEAHYWSRLFGFQVHYAIKANMHPGVMKALRQVGFGADCVSGGEILHAIRHGFAPGKIVFAGVGKTDKEIRTAIEADIFCFNVESLQEIDVLAEIAGSYSRQVRVCLRVAPGVNAETHAYISTGENIHKFGIREDQLEKALDSISKAEYLDFYGLHVHIGSQIRNMKVFARLSQRVNQLQNHIEAVGFKAKHINLGGGLGVDYSSSVEILPDFEAYFSTLNTHLQRRKNQQVHVELGRSLTAGCGTLLTRVLYVKPSTERTYAIVDAGMSELLRPALYGSEHPVENLRTSGQLKKIWIGGPVCESSDILAKGVLLPEVKRGDILAFSWTGAYGQVMASRYNLRPKLHTLCSDEMYQGGDLAIKCEEKGSGETY